ncbi:Ulp1 protease family [Abeliophyllum distichum]|uniref:Ulp1 protease family n=1 Tax=Abeliophyllum distichum TaxID=126358 RepID=A0ABD1W1T8_9LAMI
MESFLWGKELYSLTLMSLKGAFSKRIMKLEPSKKNLEYRLNGFLLAFQVWIYETIPAIAAKKLCVKYKQSLPRILSWSFNVHLTSLQLNKRIFDLIKRHSESNEEILRRLVEIEVKLQSNEEILKRIAEIEAKVESNDIILKYLIDIESKIQSNEEIQNRLVELEMKVQSNIQIEKQIKELEEKVKSNEKILERVANVGSKVNDLQKLKNDAKNVANDTMDMKKNLTDCPSFSLGIEFDMTGKSIEGPAETNVEKSPWVNQYDSAVGTSTVGTTKRVLKGTSAFKVGLFSTCRSDVEAFEGWYKQGLVTKKNQVWGLYDDFSKDPLVLVKQTSLLSYPIGLYMPCNTSWQEVDHVLMPLRMYNSTYWILCHFDIKDMCLNTYNSYTKIVKKAVVFEAVRPFSVMILYLLFHTGFFKGKNIPEHEALKPLVVKMVPKLPQQKNDGNCGIYVIKYAEYFINEMLKEMPKIFNIAQVRKHLATQLYVYAKKKQLENYNTDNDWVSKGCLTTEKTVIFL